MSKFTPYEQILRLAISGKMWIFMDDEHHTHVRENLVTKKEFWVDYVDENDPDRTMGMIIERAEKMGLPYNVSDDLGSFIMEDEEKKGPIYMALIEVPDDDYDEDDLGECDCEVGECTCFEDETEEE